MKLIKMASSFELEAIFIYRIFVQNFRFLIRYILLFQTVAFLLIFLLKR